MKNIFAFLLALLLPLNLYGASAVTVNSGYFSETTIDLMGGSGNGSTATKILRFTTVNRNVGTDATLTQSATNGDSVLINTAGVYAITVMSYTTAADSYIGITKSASSLTTNVISITGSEIAAYDTIDFNKGPATVTWVGYLAAGVVIRAHDHGATKSTSDTQQKFVLTRVK